MGFKSHTGANTMLQVNLIFGEHTQGLSIHNERHVEMTVMFP